MIATNEQIKSTLMWFINRHSKDNSKLIGEYFNNQKDYDTIQLKINANFAAIYDYISIYKKLFPNDEMFLNG